MNREELQKEFDRIVRKAGNWGVTEKKILDSFSEELCILRNGGLPASIKHHHSGKDGLLQHTVEVCKIIETLKPDLDYVLVAGLLHDIGKVYEYKVEFDDSNNIVKVYKDVNRKINHSQYAYKRIASFDKFIAGLVACHMGRKEWGAVFNIEEYTKTHGYRQELFYLLHFADMVSAKLLLGEQNAF